MLVKFLGTAAAEGIPALWCVCDNCTAARRERGRSLRRRCALLVDDRLLVDCGPDLVAAASQLGLDVSAVRTLLITHDHEDHLHVPSLEIRRAGFRTTPLPTMDIYSGHSATERLRGGAHDEAALQIRAHEISPFEPFSADGYSIVGLRAAHGTPDIDPLFFAVSAGADGPRVLYAHDTGPFPGDTWDYLERPPRGRRLSFDLVSLDATRGVLAEPGSTHLTISQVLQHRDRLAESGLLRPGARVVANHFSHAGAPAHSELVRLLSGTGVEPAFDGLAVDL